jgi:hypothetical protein
MTAGIAVARRSENRGLRCIGRTGRLVDQIDGRGRNSPLMRFLVVVWR